MIYSCGIKDRYDLFCWKIKCNIFEEEGDLNFLVFSFGIYEEKEEGWVMILFIE